MSEASTAFFSKKNRRHLHRCSKKLQGCEAESALGIISAAAAEAISRNPSTLPVILPYQIVAILLVLFLAAVRSKTSLRCVLCKAANLLGDEESLLRWRKIGHLTTHLAGCDPKLCCELELAIAELFAATILGVGRNPSSEPVMRENVLLSLQSLLLLQAVRLHICKPCKLIEKLLSLLSEALTPPPVPVVVEPEQAETPQ